MRRIRSWRCCSKSEQGFGIVKGGEAIDGSSEEAGSEEASSDESSTEESRKEGVLTWTSGR